MTKMSELRRLWVQMSVKVIVVTEEKRNSSIEKKPKTIWRILNNAFQIWTAGALVASPYPIPTCEPHEEPSDSSIRRLFQLWLYDD